MNQPGFSIAKHTRDIFSSRYKDRLDKYDFVSFDCIIFLNFTQSYEIFDSHTNDIIINAPTGGDSYA